MMQRLPTSSRSFFPSIRASLLAGLAVAALLVPGARAFAQEAAPSTAPSPSGQPNATPAQAAGTPQADPTLTATPQNGTKRIKEKLTRADKKADKVVQSKDTRRALTREKKLDPLAGQDSKLPDRQLYDKALVQIKKGHFDVARLDLQTLLNTYPDSQYQMRAKLAIADSWYKEGGTAALTQAESEYSDFRVFFPNSPEAAEAQMRIGDIYFRQMDKPDRDFAKATHAQEEYRRMLTDYSDSKLAPQAKQRLRDVQEALATREASIGDYYSTHENWPATIARYQTVINTYPLYSHMDDVLIGLGDAYAAQARYIRSQTNLPEAGRARLLTTYDGKAAAAYRAVVLDHSASAHVEDARDRLAAMNLPIPNPSVDQAQVSQALENSRAQYRLQDRARLLIFHQPDVVSAARVGEPPLVDPKIVNAPAITREIMANYNEVLHPGSTTAATTTAPGTPAGDAAAASAAAPASQAPLALQDVPNSDSTTTPNDGSVTSTTPAPATGSGGASMGAEILTPGANGNPATPAPINGLNAVGPTNTTSLPPIEKAGEAPDQVNDLQGGAPQPAAQAAPADGKKQKSPGFDKGDESSSKHKKKKGVDKLNPF